MIIFLLLVISIPFVQSTYNSTITKIKSPCIYGYHFKVLDNQTSVTECYTFDQNELVVEGKSLNLGIYISKKYITTHKTSRCGECLEMTSTGGIMYKVMINGYHNNPDEHLIYGSRSIFDQLSTISDGISMIPIAIRIVSCPFSILPSIVTTDSNTTHVQLQPINTHLPHHIIQYDNKEYKIDKQTGKYTLPYFEKATMKLLSLQRIGLSFTNVQSKKNSVTQAIAKFPSIEIEGSCQFIP